MPRKKAPPPPLDLSRDTRSKRLPRIARAKAVADVESKPLMNCGISSSSSSSPEEQKRDETIRRALRIACGCVHMLLSTALLVVLVSFLVVFRGDGVRTAQGPGVVALAVSLALDMTLSLVSVGLGERQQPQQPWSSCVLCLRLVLTCVYTVLLIANAIRGLFPESYTFWRLEPHCGNIVALAFLGIVILLNIAQAVMERQALASFAQRQVMRLGQRSTKSGHWASGS